MEFVEAGHSSPAAPANQDAKRLFPLPQGEGKGEGECAGSTGGYSHTSSLTPALSRWERENHPQVL
jgi:hypothetical protein